MESTSGHEPIGTAGQRDREPWSAPRLTRLAATATAAGGFFTLDNIATMNPMVS